jgi:serine/threonine-protein kinase
LRTPGEQFAHYQIELLLGQGGMGEVYRAFDTKLHRRVALKLLLTTESTSREAKTEAVARIIREARAAAALEHPNKVSIFELGEVDGTPYLAMEYIAGSTLRSFVGDATVDWKQKLSWLIDVARALDAAHTAGLVHRDIKPENVMVREDGIVKVLDFGIARRADAPVDPSMPTVAPSIETLTGKGVVIGTAAYMPPEQMQGHELDGRADQFSWAVMAFELLSGRHPWSSSAGGSDALALIGAMLTKPAAPLEVPSEVVAGAVARALQPNASERFPKMSEVVALLAPLVGQSGPAAVVSTNAAVSPAATTDIGMARTEVGGDRVPIPLPPAKSGRGWGRRAVLAGVAFAGIAGFAGGAWRWVTRTTIEHCVVYATTSTGPRCVGPVSPGVIGHRSRTYRLTSDRHGVALVERLNVGGIPLADAGEAVRLEVRRGEDGAIREIIGRDFAGEEVTHEVWSEGGKQVDYVDTDGKTPRHMQRRGTRATSERREVDARGFVRRESYFGVTGKPRASKAGVFGRELEHAIDGFVLRETYLGADGKPMADAAGLATIVRVAGPDAVEAEVHNLDLEGKPILVDGVAVTREEYTADLGPLRDSFFDAKGAKTAKLGDGVHRVQFARDLAARKQRITFLDENEKIRQRKGDTFGTVEITTDGRGREIERTFLDVAGNPVVSVESGSATTVMVWSDRDDVVEYRQLDGARRLMPSVWGYARRADFYDERGNRLEERHYDVDGNIAPWLRGSGVGKFAYDDRGMRIGVAFFDGDGRPALHSNGFSSVRTKFDRLRNEIEFSAFDRDGKPTLWNEGYSVERSRFDDDDNRVETVTLDASGAPTVSGGYAKTRVAYDERGLVTQRSYFDTNDNPMLTSEGVASVRYVLDRSGDVIEFSCFGKRGEPTTHAGGYAKKKHGYDLHRRLTETTLFDASGAPAPGTDGWAIERLSYDDRGLVIRESHFDAAGRPVVTKQESASVAKKYDGRGNLVEEQTLGASGEPIVVADGWATRRRAYDERDLLIEESVFGADGAAVVGKRGWSVRKLRYDELGNPVDESFFDADHKPVVAKDPAYARKRDKYDARRSRVETTYFDPSGAPAKGPEGVETIRFVRDAYGHAVETSYFDAASAPALSKDGKQLVRAKYDDAFRLIEESFFDAAGKPRPANDGCASRRTRYDERGWSIEETCHDAQGGLAVSTEGWASKRLLRNARGHAVDEATYGADGKLRGDATGIARKKNQYDERGLLLETTFWGVDDKPAKDKGGAIAVRHRYDDAGKRVETTAVAGKGGAGGAK